MACPPPSGARADTVDVILPVLNEAENLPWLLGRFPEGFRPLVVDNGSTDGSADVAAGMGCTVVAESRGGFGSACWAGLNASNADTVCFMDADGSLDPLHLPSVADPVIEGATDLCLGRRMPERGAMSTHARLGNAIVVWRLSKTIGVQLRDLGPMRAARRDGLLGLGIEDRRFGWPLEMVVRAKAAGWRIAEVDVPYSSRRAGTSKVTGTVSGTLRTVRDMWRFLA